MKIFDETVESFPRFLPRLVASSWASTVTPSRRRRRTSARADPQRRSQSRLAQGEKIRIHRIHHVTVPPTFTLAYTDLYRFMLHMCVIGCYKLFSDILTTVLVWRCRCQLWIDEDQRSTLTIDRADAASSNEWNQSNGPRPSLNEKRYGWCHLANQLVRCSIQRVWMVQTDGCFSIKVMTSSPTDVDSEWCWRVRIHQKAGAYYMQCQRRLERLKDRYHG